MPATARAPRTFTIPKPGGGVRLMTELAPEDADAWRRLAIRASERIEAALGPDVAGNRWDRARGRLAPFRPALLRTRERASALAGRAGGLVRTDVRAFYGSVTPSSLDTGLAAAGVGPDTRRAATHAAERWSEQGVPGLPVGPEPSALFANAVLAPVDAALRAAGIRFLRWVDDYLLVPGRGGPQRSLDVLDEALERTGLRRRADKTAIGVAGPWPGGTYGLQPARGRTMPV